MSFDQTLISRGNDGIYAAAWIAGSTSGQALAKYYKSHDIESVNVPKTCDKLHLALRKQHQLETQNCVVKDNEDGIPFRICSNLFFGTLKIYQQQVNNLYKLSEDLVIKSNNYDIHEPPIKRKKSSNNKTIKRRRLTITHSSEYDGNSNYYSQILEDLEALAQEAESNIEDETAQNNVPSIQTNTKRQPMAKLQIREITMREINATYGIPELDDDCGFGAASNEEIINFFTFSDANDEHHNSFAKRTPSKRKSAYEEKPPKKLRRLSEGEYLTSSLKGTPPKRKNSYEEDQLQKQSHDLKYNISCNPKPCENTNDREDEAFADNMNSESISPNYLQDNIKQEYDFDHEMNNIKTPMDIKVPILTDSKKIIKEEHDEIIQIDVNTSSKLIIDQCIKLEETDMIEQLLKPHKGLRGVIKNISRKSKKRISAMELLKRYNKRTSIFCCLTLKQKSHNDSIKLQQDYLALLRDIFKTDYKDEWESTIYPKGKNTSKPPKNSIKQKQIYETPNKNTEQTTNCDFHLENNDIVVNTDDNMCWANSKPLESLNCQALQKMIVDKENLEDLAISNEWRPCGVMTKLLKIWRYSILTEINANDFCHSARVQIYKALAFSSLLSLSKSRFIFVTKRFNTIEMDKITLGAAAKSFMKAT